MTKNFLVSVILILVTAVGFRLADLNSLPIFADESIYVRWSQVMRVEPSLRFLPLSDGKQPLFMWATIPLFKIFSDPLVAGRLLSVFAGFGTLIGIFFVSYVLFANKRLSLIATGIGSVLPYLVFFNRMAMADSLLAMFMIWTMGLSLYALKHDRWDWSIIAGFTFGLAWLTKSPAIFMFGLLPLGLLFAKLNLKSLFYLVTTFVVGIAMYNILRLGPEFSQIALRNKDYVFTLAEVIKHPWDPFTSHIKDSAIFYLYFVTPVGLLLAMWGIIGQKYSHLKQKIVLVGWFLIPILVQSAFAKQFTARYILFTVPFAIILMALAIEQIGQHTKRHILSLATLGLVIVPSIYLDYSYVVSPNSSPLPRIERSGYLEEWTAGTGIKQISEYLSKINGPIVVGSEGFFGTPFDGLQLYLNNYKNIRVVGVGVWIDSVDSKLKNALVDNKVFLVVNSDRLHVDPNTLGLRLIASYPKAIRPDRTQQSLLFFEVTGK